MVRLRSSTQDFDLDWSALITSLPDVCLIVDRDGKILFINRGESGADSEEVLKHTVFDYAMGDFHAQLTEKLHGVYDTGCQDRIEVKRSDPDFSERWWSIAMSPLRQGDEVAGVLFLCRDVTNLQNVRREHERSINDLKRKFWRENSAHDRAREILIEEIAVRQKTEEALRASEERYRELVENARNAIFSVNYEGFFVFLNPIAAQSLGGVPKDYVGKHMTELFPPDIASRQLETVRRVIDTRKEELIEAMTMVQGRPRWYLTSIRPIVEASGNCEAVLLEATDIDDRVKAMQQLERERDFSSTILRIANSLIICLDSQARILVFNSCAEEMTGYKFEEVVGRLWPELFLPIEDREQRFANFAEMLRTHPRLSYEGRVKCRSGEIRTVFWSGSSLTLPDTGELIGVAIGIDITKFNENEQRLRESELRLNLAVAGTGAGLWDWEMESDVVYFSPRWKAMLGYEDHEIENSFAGWQKLWHPDDATKIEKAMSDYMTGTTEQYEVEYRLRHKEGDWRRIITRGGIFEDSAGRPLRWIGTNIDVTNLRRLETEVRDKSEELDRYFSFSLDLLCIASTSGKFIRLNPEWERVLGYPIAELEGRSFLTLIHPDDLENTREALSRLEAQEEVRSFENRYRCRDGSYRWIEWRSRAEGDKIYAAARDITERNRMRDTLSASEARNRAMLRVHPDLIFVIDSAGYYREFAGGYKGDLLVPAEKVVGAHITGAISPPLSDELLLAVNKAISEDVMEVLEYTLDLPSGPNDFEARCVRCGEDECLAVVRNVTERKRMENELKQLNEKLRIEQMTLTETNTTLKVVLTQIRQEVEEVKSQVSRNVEELILPVINRLRQSAPAKNRIDVDQLESLLSELTSSFASNLNKKTASLTRREIEICNMIRCDFQSKQIADRLNLSLRTVEKFRQRIRIKLELANQDINLATFLKSL